MSYTLTSIMKSCRECGKPLPLTAKNNTLYCPECARKRNLAHQKAWREANKAHIAREAKADYEYYKEHGICTSCGNRPAIVLPTGKTLTLCEKCAEVRRKRIARYRAKKKKRA